MKRYAYLLLALSACASWSFAGDGRLPLPSGRLRSALQNVRIPQVKIVDVPAISLMDYLESLLPAFVERIERPSRAKLRAVHGEAKYSLDAADLSGADLVDRILVLVGYRIESRGDSTVSVVPVLRPEGL